VGPLPTPVAPLQPDERDDASSPLLPILSGSLRPSESGEATPLYTPAASPGLDGAGSTDGAAEAVLAIMTPVEESAAAVDATTGAFKEFIGDDDDDEEEEDEEGAASDGSDEFFEVEEVRKSYHYSHNVLLQFQTRNTAAPAKENWEFIRDICCAMPAADVIKMYNAQNIKVSFSAPSRHRGATPRGAGGPPGFGSGDRRGGSGRGGSGGSGGGGGGGRGSQGRGGLVSPSHGRGAAQGGRHGRGALDRAAVAGPDPSLPQLQKAQTKWQAGLTGMTEALGEAAKKIKGILNKVTAENYPRLSVQMMEIVTATVTRVEQLAEVCAL
jgi:hypothetical protein